MRSCAARGLLRNRIEACRGDLSVFGRTKPPAREACVEQIGDAGIGGRSPIADACLRVAAGDAVILLNGVHRLVAGYATNVRDVRFLVVVSGDEPVNR
jgi:hypothetical protein